MSRLIPAYSREVDFPKDERTGSEPGERVLLPRGRKGISFLEGGGSRATTLHERSYNDPIFQAFNKFMVPKIILVDKI